MAWWDSLGSEPTAADFPNNVPVTYTQHQEGPLLGEWSNFASALGGAAPFFAGAALPVALGGGLAAGGTAAASELGALGFAGETAAEGSLPGWLGGLGEGGMSGGYIPETGSAFSDLISGAGGYGGAGETPWWATTAGMDTGNLAGATGAGGVAEAVTQTSGPLAKETSLLSKLGTGAIDSITKNPLGIAAAGVGLGATMLRGNPADPMRDRLAASAAQLDAQGEMLRNYLTSGTLPPALQARLDQATQAAKAKIIANHARNGMNTDPAQNSALAQELAAADLNAVAAMADAQVKMLQTGLNETGLSTQLYEMLVKMDRQDNQDLMAAISNFASALGGGGFKKAA